MADADFGPAKTEQLKDDDLDEGNKKGKGWSRRFLSLPEDQDTGSENKA